MFASPSAALPKGVCFAEHSDDGDAHLSLSVSWEKWSSLKQGENVFVMYCSFINPFCLFSYLCLGLGPFGVSCKTLQEVESLPKFLAEELF